MAITPPALVAGAPRTPFTFGLFSVVPFREGSRDRWFNGVEFESIGCPGELAGIGSPSCDPETETVGLPLEPSEFSLGQDLGEADAFTVYETYKCTPIGNTLGQANEVAQARLQAWEQMRVEQALSTGAFGQSPNFTQAEDLGEADSLSLAIATLEMQIAQAYGMHGILHMSLYTATLALDKGLLETSGQRLRTKLGTPVVAGAGYTFEGIVATPAMFGYRSEIYWPSNQPGDLLNRATNDLIGIAHRDYLLAMEPCGMWKMTFSMNSAGTAGPAGASAFEIAVADGFEGDEAQWLESLQGQDGQDGQDGTNGTDGTDGTDGVVQEIVAGDGVTVDSSDPANPIVSTSA